MKLICLNIWGGHIKEPLLEFVKAHRDIDVFCFQEVYHKADRKVSDEDRAVSLNIFSELQVHLSEHKAFFRPTVNQTYGIGMMVKKEIEVVREGEVVIHENPHYHGIGPTHSRNLQWVECRLENQTYTIINLHGLWNGLGKTDSPERISQAFRIKAFVEAIDSPKIVCGDFNLRPDTESMQVIEQGMHNLIKTHGISSTRTSHYSKKEKFADYILTSPEVKVADFKVLEHEVSDHAPLLLDFS